MREIGQLAMPSESTVMDASDDVDVAWVSQMFDASTLGPAPRPAQPVTQAQLQTVSTFSGIRQMCNIKCDTAPSSAITGSRFAAAMSRHLDSFRANVCMEYEQISMQYLDLISALQRENRELKTQLSHGRRPSSNLVSQGPSYKDVKIYGIHSCSTIHGVSSIPDESDGVSVSKSCRNSLHNCNADALSVGPTVDDARFVSDAAIFYPTRGSGSSTTLITTVEEAGVSPPVSMDDETGVIRRTSLSLPVDDETGVARRTSLEREGAPLMTISTGETALFSSQESDHHQTEDRIASIRKAHHQTVDRIANIRNVVPFELWDTWSSESSKTADQLRREVNTLQAATWNSGADSSSRTSSLGRGSTKTELFVARGCISHDKCLLDPSSNFCLIWQTLCLLIMCYELVLFPMDVFEFSRDGFVRIMSAASATVWTFEMVFAFNTSFYTQDGTHITSRRSIARNYIKNWFTTDMLVLVFDWLAVMADDGTGLQAFRFAKALRISRISRLLRLLRLRKLREAMRRLDDFVNSLYFSTLKSIIVNMVGILVTSHMLGCLWYWVGTMSADEHTWIAEYDIEHHDWKYKYATSLHWSITQFTPGSMNIQPQNFRERSFAVTTLVLGMVIFSSIISNVTTATNNLKKITAKYDEELTQLRRFFRQESISKNLMMRIMRYADNVIKPKMLKVYPGDVSLVRFLPRPLYMEVVLEMYDQDLDFLDFFSVLRLSAPMVMAKICCQGLSSIALSKQAELFGVGDKADAVYFFTKGHMQYTPEHDVPVMVEAQSPTVVPICEAILWVAWHMHGRMVADSECELLQIDATTFRIVLASNRKAMPLAQLYSMEFARGLNELADSAPSKVTDLVHIPTATALLVEMRSRLRNSFKKPQP